MTTANNALARTVPVKLRFPISVGGVSTDQVTLRRPTVRDRIIARTQANATAEGGEASNEELEIVLFANLCEVEREAIEGMDMGDYFAIQKVFNSFIASPK